MKLENRALKAVLAERTNPTVVTVVNTVVSVATAQVTVVNVNQDTSTSASSSTVTATSATRE